MHHWEERAFHFHRKPSPWWRSSPWSRPSSLAMPSPQSPAECSTELLRTRMLSSRCRFQQQLSSPTSPCKGCGGQRQRFVCGWSRGTRECMGSTAHQTARIHILWVVWESEGCLPAFLFSLPPSISPFLSLSNSLASCFPSFLNFFPYILNFLSSLPLPLLPSLPLSSSSFIFFLHSILFFLMF